MTRRELLALALTAAGKGKVDRSRISAITDEIARSPEDATAFLKQYGLGLAELREVPGGRAAYESLSDSELLSAARQFTADGIRISFLDAGLFKYALPGTGPAERAARDEAQFEKRMESLARAIRAAKILGTSNVRVFTFRRVKDAEGVLERVAGILEPMIALAEKEKVRLLVENEASCNVATCAELAALAKLLPSPWFGINWDSLNGLPRERPFPDGYKLLPIDRLGNVHIKGRSVLPGEQRMDWAAVFSALTRDGYESAFGLETHIFGETQIASSHASMKEILRILETA